MGVKDLWTIVSPVSEKKSVWNLQNKKIAIDLSAWICDSQNVVDYSSQRNMYLRNLFFRTSFLLLNNCKPIFVLDGDAPELKHKTIIARIQARGGRTGEKTATGSRSRLKALQNQCKQLLTIMGVPWVQAPGEAEAYCAWLNQKGEVEAVITQDSDCFLYGGRVVLRHFMLSPHYTCEENDINSIECKLSLGRFKLLAFSLLCGCDYINGVNGVGKESAVKFLSTVEEYQVLRRLREWRTDPYYKNLELKGSSQLSAEQRLELNIRKKALQDPDFPSQEIIEEFLNPVAENGVTVPEWKWRKPDLPAFIKLADLKLTWEHDYSIEKFLPLLTRWHLKNASIPSPIQCNSIVKKRVVRGMNCFEVRWTADFMTDFEDVQLVTVEPQDLIGNAYKNLYDEYYASKFKPKKVTTRKKKTAVETALDVDKIVTKNRALGSAVEVDKTRKRNTAVVGKLSKNTKKQPLDDLTNVSELMNNLSFEEQKPKKHPNKKRIKEVKGLQTIDKFLAETRNDNACKISDKCDVKVPAISSIKKQSLAFSPLLQSTPNKISYKVGCLDVSDHFSPDKSVVSTRKQRNPRRESKNNLSLISDGGKSCSPLPPHQVSQCSTGVNLSLFDLYDNDEVESFEMSAIINGIVSRKLETNVKNRIVDMGRMHDDDDDDDDVVAIDEIDGVTAIDNVVERKFDNIQTNDDVIVIDSDSD
ncbi:flap endonuclease GEN isoform X1 [Nilaparvata lugens]|uniref:flap endonuclease GEN isoform X1 n=1 Tax=Nilaparvata lugens TaxID=108931 RepID=UPI00193D4BB7|nr:flap endonuclease GEN isoform X1 [Nilaparvata lugens]